MHRELTVALEELKTTALEVRLKEREATQAADDLKQQLKEVAGGATRDARRAPPARVRLTGREISWCAAGQ